MLREMIIQKAEEVSQTLEKYQHDCKTSGPLFRFFAEQQISKYLYENYVLQGAISVLDAIENRKQPIQFTYMLHNEEDDYSSLDVRKLFIYAQAFQKTPHFVQINPNLFGQKYSYCMNLITSEEISYEEAHLLYYLIETEEEDEEIHPLSRTPRMYEWDGQEIKQVSINIPFCSYKWDNEIEVMKVYLSDKPES